MPEDTQAPTLGAEEPSNQQRSLMANIKQGIKTLWRQRSDTPHHQARSHETTPLLAREAIHEDDDYTADALDQDASGGQRSSVHSSRKGGKRRIPTILSLVLLCVAVIVILGIGFAAPEAMQEYAEQASVFEPIQLSIDSFTANGVNARVQGNFFFNSSRVERRAARDIGRSLSWIAKAAETKATKVTVSLPEYDIELGTAGIPPIVVSLRDMEKTNIDIVVEVTPGDPKGLKQIASDWLEGRIGQLRLKGSADVPLKSGIFALGTQKIVQTFTFADGDVPSLPKYTISKVKVHEVDLPDNSTGLSADVSISAYNEYPVSFVIPPVAFEILVPGCSTDEPSILLANASTKAINVGPKSTVTANASGTVRHLSDTLLATCPDSSTSPLDDLLGNYIHGNKTDMYVRGSQNPLRETPTWIADLLQSIIVRVPFSGNSMDDLIRNFTMEETHFSLPNPLADPDTPQAQPRISTDIIVLANLPGEINFPLKVSRVRSIADVYYNGTAFGVLDLQKWQDATSSIVDGDGDRPRALAVHASIQDAPLGITNQDIFTEVIQGVLLGDDVILDVDAVVDIEITTTLGTFTVRKIPAHGKVPLKPLVGDGLLKGLAPAIGNLEIKSTTTTTLRFDAIVNVTNPTNYSAHVPYVNINLLYNGTLIANISLKDIHIVPGRNTGLPFTTIWDPVGLSHEEGATKGHELLSQYISGRNTSISIRTHDGSFPSTPWLGSALSSFEVKIPTPNMKHPQDPHHPGDGDDDPDGPHYIDEATMHLFTSTADFTLLSPFRQTTLFLTSIDAVAIYNHTDPIGNITYNLPIEVRPGATKTPRLPVDWSIGGVGYNAVKEALGGTLRLGAKANVTVRIEQWIQPVHFEGNGIGAHIEL